MGFQESNENTEIAAIILAAGGSHRFGSPKQLLLWQENNLVNTAIDLALEASLSPIILVLGASAESIQAMVREKDVHICFNNDWLKGQSTSLKAGLACLDEIMPTAPGVLFLLVDQPQTPIILIEAIKEKARAGAEIVLPKVGDRFANPVYFSRQCFRALQSIEGDQGGRAIFDQFPVETVDWQDARQCLDIDTPEDYVKLRALYGINDRHLV